MTPTPEPPQAPRRRGILMRLASDRGGSTAIEFTALAIPFFLLVFAILESCISFAGQEVLSNATDDVARKFRTGQIRAADIKDNTVDLRSLICGQLEVIVAKGCPGLEIDLENYSSFADAARFRIKYTPDGDIDTTGFKIDPGLSTTKNSLRVFYRWPVITDFMRSVMSNLKGGKTLHFATTTWQNEPFDD
jgi:Flp pilus assembly protein TadG